MSEAERQQRQEYKTRRKKRIYIQAVALAVLVALLAASFLVYDRMNRTYYVEYIDGGNVNYNVEYVTNEFFNDGSIAAGQSYISSLVRDINADFSYRFDIGATDVSFEYTYDITAWVVIADRSSKEVIYDYKDILIPTSTVSAKNKSSFSINEGVSADFAKYDTIAKQFVKTYGLKNATTTLNLVFNVSTTASCEKFEENKTVTYQNSLVIPLGEVNFGIHSSTDNSTLGSKLIAYEGMVNKNLFLIFGISFSIAALILAIVLVTYIFVTRNDDVNYVIKVRRLLSFYRSFIQQIEGNFNDEGYQRVEIKTFEEMLGIRDTIQSPILMSENKDETMTQFFIPTNTKILYVFEIKVDNYDELYNMKNTVNEDDTVELV